MILVLVMLAFQSLGMNSLAAPVASSLYFQEGRFASLPLTCDVAPAYSDVEILLMIDDSGSMWTNDRPMRRNATAKEMVDSLATLYYLPALKSALESGLEAPNVQVAVIHFSDRIRATSELIKLNPNGLDYANYKWEDEDQKHLYGEIDKVPQVPYTLQKTDFTVPLLRAKELWQGAQDDGTLRTIMIFTDGTPEEGQGPISGNKLRQKMEQVGLTGKELPKLYGLYVIGYKVAANYLTEEIKNSWIGIATTLSTPQEGVPNVTVLEKEDSLAQFEEDLKKIKATSSNVSRVESNAALLKYRNLTVEFDDNELGQLQVDKQSDIRFKFVDSSDGLGLPEANSGYTLEVAVSVTESGSPATSLSAARNGDNYQVSWTPKSAGKGQFEVIASLVGATGEAVLNCPGNVEVVINQIIITDTPSPTPAVDITLTPTPTPPPEPIPPDGCDCDVIWKLWFWPLALVLAGLLIVLLFLKFRSEPEERNGPEDKTDVARGSSWRLLFWPLLILLILEVLNRLFWCCVIPLWLFLFLMLIWIIFLLWIRFMPDDGSARRRLWWLVVILLLLLILIWYIFISNQWTFLLWLLAILLVLILAIILWPGRPSPPFVKPIPPPAPPIVPPIPPTSPDDLIVIEGIGPQVAKLLNDKGIYTFRELAEAKIEDLNAWLNERGWKYMDPKTWPQQAELADAAKRSGNWDKFNEYAAWVKDGIAPHEYNEPEKDRKPPEERKNPE